MSHSEYQIRQLADEIQPPESGQQSIVLNQHRPMEFGNSENGAISLVRKTAKR